MLLNYKPIKHNIFGAHLLIEHLVLEVFCKANKSSYKSKLNSELKILIDKNKWFDQSIKKIYVICRDLSSDEKNALKTAFITNNKIKDLCANPTLKISLDTLNEELLDEVIPFFKELYKRFLTWVDVKNKYGSKKEYYDDLIKYNNLKFCPCCGYGQIKTIYDKGHSAFDHYLPLKYYPFSVVNFNNLIPLCTVCNSDYKGETDILNGNKKVFYPLTNDIQDINVSIDFDKGILPKLIIKTEEKADKLKEKDITVNFDKSGEEVLSWNSIFNIKGRYFGEVGTNRVSWLNDVRSAYRKPRILTYNDAFDEIIEDDSNKYLGFLKSPYLKKMKSFSFLVQAMDEVSGDYIM
ncbi:hypothetical protein [Winogradskyella bathintestinalis]|uniref:HNH endonuclease n=1 Tax=Winogradskyella bathintestinalis TaxID=3035208 RepID=A0ABT7ZY85_9FLAO|nr:hypothetical protein [Winogradskyella bathintestinalis]MDN3493794.1 hypothetical protein [Winogradskyella bathintestinalis]